MAEGGADSFTMSCFEPVFDFFCEFCNENGEHLEAEGHCIECDEYLCGKCIAYHEGTRAYRYHEILDKDNMPRNTPPSTIHVRTDISAMCKQHKGEPFEYYCKSHDELTCSRCFVKRHKACTDIIDITETTNTIFDDMEYKIFKQKLKTLEIMVHNITTKSREHSSQSERYCSEAIESVRQFRDEINSVLDDIETNLKTEADAIKTKDAIKMETLGNTCRILQEEIEKISSEFRELQSKYRVCQAYIRMKETAVDVETIKQKLTEAEDRNSINEFIFVPNRKLTELLRGHGGFGLLSVNDHNDKKNQDTASMSNIGSSASHEYDKNVLSGQYKDIKTQNQAPVLNIVGPAQFMNNTKMLSGNNNKEKIQLDSTPVSKVISSASFVHDVNVKSTSDLAICCITGSAVLSDRKLLIVDNNYSKIKLIDTQSMSIISELQVSRAPWDVTLITEDYVAVTVPEQNTILVLRVTDSIIKEREIRVHGQCRGIAYSKNQLIVSYCDTGKLEIMDLQGNISITIDGDKDGKELFDRPGYIAVSNDGDTIYVSDYIRRAVGRVVSLNRNGDVKSIYTDKSLRGPQKICVDHRGNVFVCGYWSQNIHMITPDFTKIEVIRGKMNRLISNMRSVSHCRQTERLFVGMNRCNEVIVYQLS